MSVISGTFIFQIKLKVAGSITNDTSISNFGIVNANGSFTSLTKTISLNSSTNVTTVTINYVFSDNGTTNDGLSYDQVPRTYLNNATNDTLKITIVQFGSIPLSRLGNQFTSFSVIINSDAGNPTILTNTSFSQIFYGSSFFNSDISGWNTVNVINMYRAFRQARLFNKNIGNWNTSNVTNMNETFQSALIFNNGCISTITIQRMNWDVSKVTNSSNFSTSSALSIYNSPFFINKLTLTIDNNSVSEGATYLASNNIVQIQATPIDPTTTVTNVLPTGGILLPGLNRVTVTIRTASNVSSLHYFYVYLKPTTLTSLLHSPMIKNSTIPDGSDGRMLSSVDGKIVYLCTNQAVLYTSVDSGETFVVAQQNISNIATSANGKILFAADNAYQALRQDSYIKILVSYDYGFTFAQLPGVNILAVNSLACNTAGTRLVIGGHGRIYTYTTGGSLTQSTIADLSNVISNRNVILNRDNQDVVFKVCMVGNLCVACTERYNCQDGQVGPLIFKIIWSNDFGATWSATLGGIPEFNYSTIRQSPNGGWIANVFMSADGNTVVFSPQVYDMGRIWVTRNTGMTWSQSLIQPGDAYCTAAFGSQPQFLLSYDGRVMISVAICLSSQRGGHNYKNLSLSTDYGQNWLSIADYNNNTNTSSSNNPENRIKGNLLQTLTHFFFGDIHIYSSRKANNLIQSIQEAGYTTSYLKEGGYTITDLSGLGFTRNEIINAQFTFSDLRGSFSLETLLLEPNLRNADLTSADLSGTNLVNSYLSRANLTSANLINTILTGVDLSGTNLTNANLTNANVTGANLTGANLTGANLTGANLTGANLSNVIANQIIGVPVSIPPGYILTSGVLSFIPSPSVFRENGYSISYLRQSQNFTNAEILSAGYSVIDLKTALFSVFDIESNGYTIAEIIAAGFKSITPINGNQLNYSIATSLMKDVTINGNIVATTPTLRSNIKKMIRGSGIIRLA